MTDKLVTELAWQVGNLTQQLRDSVAMNAQLRKRIAELTPRQCRAVVDIRGVDVGVDYEADIDDEGPYTVISGYYIGQTCIDDLLTLTPSEEADVQRQIFDAAREEASDARIDRHLANREAA